MARNFEDIKTSLESGNISDLYAAIQNYHPTDLVELLNGLKAEDRLHVFSLLSPSVSIQVFEFLPFPIQKEILDALPSTRAAQILNNLSPDDRTQFLEALPSNIVNELLKLLSQDERALTLKLMGYPEHSVGRLMTPDYIAVQLNWTVGQVLQYIREFGRSSETIDVIYVVDDNNKLIDDIRLRAFIFASPDMTVADLSDKKFIKLIATDDEKTAISVFRKNNRIALPVTDIEGILLGIVTIDDILNLVKEEDTKEILRVGGMEALAEPYLQTPFFNLMKKRVGWLVVLFVGETFTATAMTFFEGEIARSVVLALFLPLIISSGGNSGSQASTLIVRSLALGEVTVKDWYRIMRREIIAGLFLGAVLGVIGFLRVTLWSTFSTIYGAHWFLLAVTVSLAVLGVVLWGTLTGSMLPLLLRAFRIDPAVASAPCVATIVDVTGIIIYFLIALWILSGTLLT